MCSSIGARTSSRTTPPPIPEYTNPGLNLDLGPVGIDYLLTNECSGYFPVAARRARIIARGRLRQPKRARKFVYPVYVVYPEARNEEAYEPILKGLRQLGGEVRLSGSQAVGPHLEAVERADALADDLDPIDARSAGGPDRHVRAWRRLPRAPPAARPRPSRHAGCAPSRDSPSSAARISTKAR